MSLPVPSTGKHTVAHLLGLFSQPEAVDEDYKCEGCGRCGCCSSILESIGHSEVLVLALKFNTNDERKKLRRGLVKLSQGLQVGSSNFLLCGTVVHLGGYTDAGHYIARCKGPDKKWRVYNNPVPLNTRAQELGKQHGKHLDESKLGEPLLDIVMEQGDALYVPRGFIHVADTLGQE